MAQGKMNPNFLSTKFIYALIVTSIITFFVLERLAAIAQWVDFIKFLIAFLFVGNAADKLLLKDKPQE